MPATAVQVNRRAIELELARVKFLHAIAGHQYLSGAALPTDAELAGFAERAVVAALGKPDATLAERLLSGA